jgi:hypothetical protein
MPHISVGRPVEQRGPKIIFKTNENITDQGVRSPQLPVHERQNLGENFVTVEKYVAATRSGHVA